MAGESDDTAEAATLSASAEVKAAVAAATAAPDVGATIGRYVIEERLGAGAMGVVYGARDPQLDRAVAIKLLRPGRDGEALRARLFREGQALARVAHPNVVAVHDVGTHDGQVFITMELVRGDTLRGWLRPGRPWPEALAMLRQAGRGLAAAHAAGLVHRDFKPDNVLVGADGRARVTDFGLARATLGPPSEPGGPLAPTPLQVEMTATGTFLGTPAYAAPEQLAGDGSDALGDQFSFCVATWEALYGRRPFSGGSMAELAASVKAGPPAPPPGRKVPAAIRRAIERGLAHDPAARWPAMEPLLRALSPDRRRRAVLAGAAAGVAVLGGVTAIVLATRAPAAAPACSGLDAPLAGIWDATVAAQVEQRFAASGQAARFPPVRGALDRYAADWRAMREDACRAARVRRDQSEADLSARNRCLDDRLAELSAVSRELTGADAAAIERASGAVRLLGAVESCRSPAGLATFDPPPAAIADEVTGLFRELTRANVRGTLHGVAEGQKVLAPVRARAEQLGYAPLLAAAQGVAGVLAWQAGDYRTAAEEMRASMMAAERLRWDWHKAGVAIALARVLVEQRAYAEAERMAELAEATIARLGGDVGLASQLRVVRGVLLMKTGRAADAVPLLEQDLAAREQQGADPMEIGNVLLELQVAYSAVGRHADAAAVMARYATIVDAYFGDTPEGRMSALETQSAQAMQRGDLARAAELAEQAFALMKQHRAGDADGLAKAELNLVTSYVLVEDWERVRRYARNVVTAYEQLGRPVQAAYGLEYAAMATGELGDPAGGLAEARRSVTMAEGAGTEGAEQAMWSRYTLGKLLVDAGRDDEALVELRAVLPRLQEAPGVTGQVIGSARFAIARALWRRDRRGDRAEARALAEQARHDLATQRDRSRADEPIGAIYRRRAERMIAKIDAWTAARER